MSGKSPRAEDDPVVRGMRCVHMSHPWRTIGEPTAPGTIVYLRVRVGDGSLHVTGLGLMSKKEPNDFLSHDNIWTAESFQFLQVQLYISFQYGVCYRYILYIYSIYPYLLISPQFFVEDFSTPSPHPKTWCLLIQAASLAAPGLATPPPPEPHGWRGDGRFGRWSLFGCFQK